MVTIHREAGFRFVIFSNDHEPAHVHVFGDGEAKVDLMGQDGGIVKVRCYGMSQSDMNLVMRLVRTHRFRFLARWKEIHGRLDRF